MDRRLEFTVVPEYDGRKALHFLRGYAGISARTLAALKRTPGGILRNGSLLRTIDIINAGDVICVTLPPDRVVPEPSQTPVEVIYADSDILAVNKSPFMAMHPTHNHLDDTLANAVAGLLLSQGRPAAFRAVGRLDKGTSGVVLCALNRYAAARLAGAVQKEYLAVVSDRFEGTGTVDAPIYRPDPMKTLRACGRGERAVTHWSSLYSSRRLSLLRVSPQTGRTHQIRVHFAHLGAPLVGDSMYGEDSGGIGHQLLHCERCAFTHPLSGARVVLRAQPPEDFLNFCRGFIPENEFDEIFKKQ